jgi:outer membrane lipoprotein-sorting protein
MVMYDGTFTVITSLDTKEADFYTQLYNFNLDGDNTYVVNNYVVHNT